MPDAKTMKVIFTADANYATVPPVKYVKGQVEIFREDIAMRWIGRGVATDDAELIKNAEAAAKAGQAVALEKVEKLPEGVPANWRTLGPKEAIAVAVDALKTPPANVQNRAQAMAIIAAKVADANAPTVN